MESVLSGHRARSQPARHRTRVPACSLVNASIGVALLICGGLYYGCRMHPPLIFLAFGIPSFSAGTCPQSEVLDALPTFVHVAGISLITCALLRPSVLSAVLVAGLWASIDSIWEMSCPNGSLVLAVPVRCTRDVLDIWAAAAGFVAAVTIAAFPLFSDRSKEKAA